MRRHVVASLLVLASILSAVGCGGTAGAGGANPASALPADAPVYLELVVRPEGAQREKMVKLLGKVMRTDDPGKKLVELLDDLGDDEGASYEKDIKPWLGERAGMSLSNFQADEPTFLVAVAAKDPDKASDAVAARAEKDSEKRASYKDVDFWTDEEGQTSAVVGDFLVVASDAREIKRAIDVKDGASLAESARFKQAIDQLPGERAGAMYVDIKRLLDSAKASGDIDAMSQQIFKQIFGAGDLPPTALALLAEEDLVAIEARAKKANYSGVAKLFSGVGYFGSTKLVGEVPDGAFAAAGIPKLGATAKKLVQTFAGAFGGAAITGQLEQQLGINLDRDVFGWLGDVAIFVRGTDPASIDGGLLVEVLDQAAAKAALPKLMAVLQQQGDVPAKPVAIDGADLAFEVSDGTTPKPIVAALAGERFVIAYGREAAADAIKPDRTLSDTDLWARAGDALDGVDPSLVLDFPAVLKLVETMVAADPGYADAKPYLDAIGVIASGAKEDGDTIRSRFAVGIK
jgi:hypothetical protein